MGIPYELGCSCGLGAKYAPQVIRELSTYLPPYTLSGESIKGFKLYDYGDTTDFSLAMDLVIKALQNNKFNLAIGGDHSISIPLQANFYDDVVKRGKTPVIIHIDAHPDFCDFYDGSKYSHACPNMRAYEKGYSLENITLIGIRGYERQEVEFFEKHPEIKIYEASYILDNGIEQMLNEITQKYSDEKYEIYLSYDIDANDPSFVTGTGTPEAFGLHSYTLLKILINLISKLNITAMDIVEVSPNLDDKNNTASWLVLKTLYEIFKELIEKR